MAKRNNKTKEKFVKNNNEVTDGGIQLVEQEPTNDVLADQLAAAVEELKILGVDSQEIDGLEVQEPAEEVVPEEQAEDLTVEQLEAAERIAELEAQIEEIKNPKPKREPTIAEIVADLQTTVARLMAERDGNGGNSAGPGKNQRPSRVNSGRKYVLLTKTLANWGRIPQQQRDLATILTANMIVGKEYSEEDVFKFIVEETPGYPSLKESRQDPTYLFRYYRGLKAEGKHAGFIPRLFLRQIG